MRTDNKKNIVNLLQGKGKFMILLVGDIIYFVV